MIDDAYLIQELLRLPGTRPRLTEKGDVLLRPISPDARRFQ